MDLDLLSPRERLELLTAYLDGELTDLLARDVTAWLDRHPEALREIEHQRRLWDLLGRYEDEHVPADFVQRVLDLTGAARARVEPQTSAAGRLTPRRWALAAAAAALLAVGVGVLAWRAGPRPDRADSDLPGGEPLALAGIDVDYVQHASVDDLLSLSDAQFEALLTEDPDELADASLGG